jgi:hypothetical protein
MSVPADEIAAVIEPVAGRLDEVERDDGPATTSYGRAGRGFAVLDGDCFHVRLGPSISRAALRTPDTAPSERGDDWVAFAPRTLDRFARDRLEAWFESAWRHAEGERA